MCDDHTKSNHDHDDVANPSRRAVLKAGITLAAAPLLAGSPRSAVAADSKGAESRGPFDVRAYGAASATSGLAPMKITRRALGPHDVLIDILYCGVCRSDIHWVRKEWVETRYPCVPGHEIVGRVQAVGSAVTKFKIGDFAGVGAMVNSCGTCENCVADLEQYCLKGATWTYDSPDPETAGHTFGGYADKVVVTERFVIRIPPGADLAATAPLLCAAITTFSPMQHWKLSAGQRVGVVGMGGLGHMAVKLAAARKADVTVFTTSPSKIPDAKRFGAQEAVLWNDTAAMQRLAGQLHLLISTVPVSYPMQPFIDLLRVDGTLVNLGAALALQDVAGRKLWSRRRSVAGSVIGGVAETQQVIDYCTARNIKADVEVIRPEQINQVFERVESKQARYRYVIDLSSGKKAT